MPSKRKRSKHNDLSNDSSSPYSPATLSSEQDRDGRSPVPPGDFDADTDAGAVADVDADADADADAHNADVNASVNASKIGAGESASASMSISTSADSTRMTNTALLQPPLSMDLSSRSDYDQSQSERQPENRTNPETDSGNGTTRSAEKKLLPLILTSEKRRGLYECDYCRTDLSQVPRICCAICPDFDLCLECFTNPKNNNSHDRGYADNDGAGKKSKSKSKSKKGGSSTSTSTAAVGNEVEHNPYTHGYRVCDSSRFFLFPTLRGVTVRKVQAASIEHTSADIGKNTVEKADAGAASGDDSQESKAAVVSDRTIDTNADVNMKDIEKISTKEFKTDNKDEISNDDVKMQDENAEGNEQNLSKDSGSRQDTDIESGKSISISVGSPEHDKDTNAPTEKSSDTQESLEKSNEIADADMKDANETAVKEKESSDSSSSQVVESSAAANDNCKTEELVSAADIKEEYLIADDAKNMWTAEEDLRLLSAISTLGLGNWIDISEEVAGTSGTTNKNPKKCMERYLNDYLGRYGEILPHYTLVELKEGENENEGELKGTHNVNDATSIRAGNGDNDKDSQKSEKSAIATLDGAAETGANTRKRRRSEMAPSRQNSSSAVATSTIFTSVSNKHYKAVPTPTLSDYKSIWPKPYIPPGIGVKAGDDIGRDLAVRAEATYVKAIGATSSKEEARALREKWEKNRLNTHGGPTVLPPRPNDVADMQGSDLAGFMPRRGDFDIEWDNDAEKLIEDMEFLPGDSKEDNETKLKVLQIYDARLNNRNYRKQFLLDRGLLDYRKKYKEMNQLPSDERDLVNRMRLFARFHSPEEHKKLIKNLLKAKRMRKEIARLQMFRRMGFTSMAEAERFELDRNRREMHRIACEEREKEEKKALDALNDGERGGQNTLSLAELSASYMKHYKPSDRSKRMAISSETQDADNTLNENGIGHTLTTLENADETQIINKVVHDPVETFDVTKCEGFELLSKKEVNLCQELQLKPALYNEAKKTIINHSLANNLLDEENSNRRTIFKIDIEKKKGKEVVDFILQAGWVPTLPHSQYAYHGR